MTYEFKNDFIKNNFENKKEYYYLGFQSIDFYITKIIYNYLIEYNKTIDFCCEFTLLQKIVKKICSKEYFSKTQKQTEKYIYSYIGAIICDDITKVESQINEIYKIEEYLLTIFKKEDNKYLYIKKYLDKNNFNITTNFIFNNDVFCEVTLEELSITFNISNKTMLEAKYNTLELLYNYLIENKMYYDISEVVDGYDSTNAFEKLKNLFKEGYINKPNYFYIEHSQYEEIKYEVRCSVEGYSFYSVKIHNNKLIAQNLAAFSMLEMITLNK